MTPGIALHVAAAGLAVVAGYGALAFRKGSRGHKLAGQVFVAAMLVMASTAFVLAALKGQTGNMVAGAIACYLVWSGRQVMRRPGRLTGYRRLRSHIWRMCTALFVATGSFFLGQADEIPAALRGPHLWVLALAPLGAMIWWMVKSRPRRSPRAAWAAGPSPAGSEG